MHISGDELARGEVSPLVEGGSDAGGARAARQHSVADVTASPLPREGGIGGSFSESEEIAATQLAAAAAAGSDDSPGNRSSRSQQNKLALPAAGVVGSGSSPRSTSHRGSRSGIGQDVVLHGLSLDAPARICAPGVVNESKENIERDEAQQQRNAHHRPSTSDSISGNRASISARSSLQPSTVVVQVRSPAPDQQPWGALSQN
jgi:hypothetical protein